jgi:hypothetical protein
MASSDNRPAFRLPWQSGNGSPADGERASGTAVVDPPAWPSHDLARRQSKAAAQTAAGPTTDSGSDTDATSNTESPTETGPEREAATHAAAEMPDAPAATRSDMTEIATQPAAEATDLRAPKRTKFLADLTRAMRLAADEARQSALAQFQADVERHTAEARGTCDAAGTDARRRADEDITSLGEWETAEIARIRRETEEGITARHGQLEAELAAQARQLEAELARVNGEVDAFAARMDTFFQGLLKEEDPARFAGMAEQLPEPPTFAAWVVANASTAAHAPLEIWSDTPAATDATVDMTAEAGTDTDADAGMPAMQQSDFAAAEAEAAAWSADETAADATSTADVEAEAEPLATAAAEVQADPEPATAEEPVADADAAAEQWPTPASPARAATVRTQVAVVGLVSVASIATFKRTLSRVQGVHGVQVSSGPDGEFLFNVAHDESLDMPKAVASVQGFEVEILESGPGIVSCKAVDPEV